MNTSDFPKPLFSQLTLPVLVTSLSEATADETVCTMRNAMFDGAEAFMIHMERLNQDVITEDGMAKICNYACDKPVFTLNYRSSSEKTDEQLMEEQFMAVRMGASMIDMMGDTYDKSPNELTTNTKAIDKQRAMIDRVHEAGGEVLMSSHVFDFMEPEACMTHAKALESRGADFVKIAMAVHSEKEMMSALNATVQIKNELKVPFLHICMGQWGKLLRAVSPMFGSCFALCVQEYDTRGHREKPLLRAEKAMLDNVDWKQARDVLTGTMRSATQG